MREEEEKKSYRILFFSLSLLEHKNKKSGKMSGTKQINYFFLKLGITQNTHARTST